MDFTQCAREKTRIPMEDADGGQMKKALVLFASPHPNGAVRRLLDAFLSGLQDERWTVEERDVCRVPAAPCRACGYCRKTDGCALHDLDDFDASLRACDLLIVASPVYNLTFPAQLKSVIDRFQRYFEARFARGVRPAIEKPRQAVLLLTMGRHDAFAVEVCERMLRQSFSVMNTALRGTVCLTDTDAGTENESPVFEKARRIAIEIGRELCYNNLNSCE
ncbi:MAG: flavodoxin family protein [Hominenteromicrobium sp.]